jgi:hypothetical protein
MRRTRSSSKVEAALTMLRDEIEDERDNDTLAKKEKRLKLIVKHERKRRAAGDEMKRLIPGEEERNHYRKERNRQKIKVVATLTEEGFKDFLKKQAERSRASQAAQREAKAAPAAPPSHAMVPVSSSWDASIRMPGDFAF